MTAPLWVIERKHPTENDNGWTPVPGRSFRRRLVAELFSVHQTNKWWEYRAVEYVRKEPTNA